MLNKSGTNARRLRRFFYRSESEERQRKPFYCESIFGVYVQ